MATISLHCWSCGAPVVVEGAIFRSTTCQACDEDVHVCLLCEHYDTSAHHSCREPMAENVKEKSRANFCVYFKPCDRAQARRADDKVDAAKRALEDLFKF